MPRKSTAAKAEAPAKVKKPRASRTPAKVTDIAEAKGKKESAASKAGTAAIRDAAARATGTAPVAPKVDPEQAKAAGKPSGKNGSGGSPTPRKKVEANDHEQANSLLAELGELTKPTFDGDKEAAKRGRLLTNALYAYFQSRTK